MAVEPSRMDSAKVPPLSSGESAQNKDLASAVPLPLPPIDAVPPLVGKVATSEADALRDDPESGRMLAEHMVDAGYQPVILFGNAASGKTSLILSLLSTVKMDARLNAGLSLGSPILDTTKKHGAYLWEQASQFYGLKTQQFIEGTASPRTNIDLPFFIPLVFRPTDKPEAKLAFMESNGEWYRPDRGTSRLFPALKKQIEEFLKHYSGGIVFIHLLPYTQRHQYTTGQGGSETDARSEASLAIAGALEEYNNVRPDKSADHHLILVTKWDAHRSGDPDGNPIDDLHDDPALVNEFVSRHYAQALTAFRALRLRPEQMQMNGYCSGQIAGNTIIALTPGDERGDAIRRFPIGLWRWLYRRTLEGNGLAGIDPFPTQRAGLFAWFGRWLNRVF